MSGEEVIYLSKKSETVSIEKGTSYIVETKTKGGTDTLRFDGYSSSEVESFKFVQLENDSSLYIKTADDETIVKVLGYFTTDGKSTKSTVKKISYLDSDNQLVTKTIIDEGLVSYSGEFEKDGKNRVYGTIFSDEINMSATSIGVTIYANKGNDNITGTIKDDTIKAEYGNNTITGNKGNDKLYAGKGEDTFIYKEGDGNDLIYSSDISDKIIIDGRSNLTYETFYKDGDNLVINTTENGSITIVNYFKQKEGTALDNVNGLSLREDIQLNISGSGKINGTYFNDVITTSVKNDVMYGGKGSNTYIFEDSAFGKDTVNVTVGANDTLRFYAGAKLTYVRNGNDVVISVNNINNMPLGTVTIKNYLKTDNLDVSIQIGENGELKSLETLLGSIKKRDFSRETKGVTYKGTWLDETITGSDNGDKLYAVGGEDTIIGGKGNDKLYAGTGETTFFFEQGSGKDTIYLGSGDSHEEKIEIDGLDLKELSYFKSKNNLIITRTTESADGVVNDSITLANYFKTDGTTVSFSDYGDLIDVIEMKWGNNNTSKSQKITGTFLDDVFTTSRGKDTIYTGAGNDTVYTSTGNDTINITGGGYKEIIINNVDGADTITGISNATSTQIQFEDDVTLSYERNGNNLIIHRKYTVYERDASGNEYYVDYYGNLTTEKYSEVYYTEDDRITGMDFFTDPTGAVVTSPNSSVPNFEYYGSETFWQYADSEELIMSDVSPGEGYTLCTKVYYYQVDGYDVYTASPVRGVENNPLAPEYSVYKKYGTEDEYTTDSFFEYKNQEKTTEYTDKTTLKDYFANPVDVTLKVGNESKSLLEEMNMNGVTFMGNSKKNNTLIGTGGDDIFYGGTKKDIINTGEGHNTVYICSAGSTFVTDVIDDVTTGGQDTYIVNKIRSNIYIDDNMGYDVLRVEGVKFSNVNFVFDVDKNGDPSTERGYEVSGNLIITEKAYTNNLLKGNFSKAIEIDGFKQGVVQDDEDFVYVQDEEFNIYSGEIEELWFQDENGVLQDYYGAVWDRIDKVTNDVRNFLNATDFNTAAQVLEDGKSSQKSALLEIYKSGNNKYNFSDTDSVMDVIGDSDSYTVSSSFDFLSNKLEIADYSGEKDVLSVSPKASQLAFIYDVEVDDDGNVVKVGELIHVFDKTADSFGTGIQTTGIDTVKAAGKTVTFITDEITSSVASFLSEQGFSSVGEYIDDANANVQDLIQAYAPNS